MFSLCYNNIGTLCDKKRQLNIKDTNEHFFRMTIMVTTMECQTYELMDTIED